MNMSLFLENSSFPIELPQHVNISRIELFVIPALAVDSTGFRVCLRLTSDLGIGWSEQFICENDASFDLEHWRELLQSFIGRFPLTSVTERLTEIIMSRGESDKRVCQMFITGMEQIREMGMMPSIGSVTAFQAEESVLQQRAVAYLSLD
jgi:hypothetical protein